MIRASLARGDDKIECHHSEGIRFRCCHLRTAAGPAPISDAKASGEGQSPITAEKSRALDIKPLLGQFVLNCKAKMSRASYVPWRQNRPMQGDQAKSTYKRDFQARVREARIVRDLTQDQMAELLNLGEGGQGKYKQYETRDFLPHHLVQRFCLIVGVDANWLLTGIGRAPGTAVAAPEKPQKASRVAASKRKDRAA